MLTWAMLPYCNYNKNESKSNNKARCSLTYVHFESQNTQKAVQLINTHLQRTQFVWNESTSWVALQLPSTKESSDAKADVDANAAAAGVDRD